MKEIKLHSPASVSNVTCGFDVLGFALEEPFDEMAIRLREDAEIKIFNESSYPLPENPSENVAGVALMALRSKLQKDLGFDVVIKKNIKPGSGIGSSSASAAGAVVGANALLGGIFSKIELAEFALMGEEIASGSRHADNIAPCIFGGVTISRSIEPLDIIPVKSPDLYVSLLHPQIEIKTSESRRALPSDIPLKDAVKQWANLAGLVAGFIEGDLDTISRCMQDHIIEKHRARLIPGFEEVKKRCISAGVLGGGISGSGPSVFMLSESMEKAILAEGIMRDIYLETGIEFNTYATKINRSGIRLLP